MDIYIYMYVYVFICLYHMDSFTTYSLRCSMNSIVFPPHTQLFGFWRFLHLHCRAKISSVVWIFYLLIFNSFEKKHYITKFPDFFSTSKNQINENIQNMQEHISWYFLFPWLFQWFPAFLKSVQLFFQWFSRFVFPLCWLFVSMCSV